MKVIICMICSALPIVAQPLIEEVHDDPQGPVVNIMSDLLVTEGAFLSFDPISLSPSWSGIPREEELREIVYRGPVQIGNEWQIHDFLTKTKPMIRGEKYVMPLGGLSSFQGIIEINVDMVGTAGSNSGAAYFKIMGSENDLVVSEKRTLGAGSRLKIHGMARRHNGALALEFDSHQDPNMSRTSVITMSIQVKAGKNYEPQSRSFSYNWVDPAGRAGMKMIELPVIEETNQPVSGNSWSRSIQSVTKKISADTIEIKGELILSTVSGDISMGEFNK